MIFTGTTRVALTVVTVFAWFAAGQRITTIQLDGTQYYISRMNPYSAELNYFLAYEYCRSIGLQLASFETLEKTNSISDFLRNAGYNKFDYWTSGNRLGTDMLIWMSTGLPFNTTFNQMKRPNNPDNNGLDNEDLKMNARPELPIARKKRGESGSRDGCVAIKAPNMDWVTADCTDLKDFICEQTRCYYYNYGSIPVSSSQGFGYKQKAAAVPIHSNISLEENTSTPTTTTTTTTTINPTTTTTIASTTSEITTTTTSTTTPASPAVMVPTPAAAVEGYAATDIRRKSEDDDGNDDDAPRSAEPEPVLTVATTSGPVVDDSLSASTTEPLQSGYQESQTDEQQSTDGRADSQYYTTELPTLIQMHNQQQHEQQQQDQQVHRHYQRDEVQQRGKQEVDRRDQLQQRNDAYAFESLEKAFATAVPHKIRSTKDLEQPKDAVAGAATGDLQLPWSWAKDIMLQKPVLKKSSQEVA
ncbi:unnamed protein product [Macrosiphum euphorbiae]|uniref:C-type lectin domain-containing protein n=1 Tax=Macrosiphum euphorbiae TaxID=13131 RepID=A0AAV0VKK3_9HEMI|nr:unnamed protein product [Macrosiphum euphorbiae]